MNAKSKSKQTMRTILASQLRQIPNCSVNSAKAISKTFGTMSNLISFVNEVRSKKQTIDFIANIKRDGGTGRRVGKSLASYIVQLFGRSEKQT